MKLENFDIESIQEQEKELLKELKGLQKSFDDTAVSQSPYQIKHFVIGQHDMPERQWWQAVIELRICLDNIRKSNLDLQELQLDWDAAYAKEITAGIQEILEGRIIKRWVHAPDIDAMKIAQIEQSRIEIQIEQITTKRMANYRKAWVLFKIKKEIEEKCNGGKPYNYHQLMEAEEKYWELRLKRNMLIQSGAGSVAGVGNVESYLQRMVDPGEINPIHTLKNHNWIDSQIESLIQKRKSIDPVVRFQDGDKKENKK